MRRNLRTALRTRARTDAMGAYERLPAAARAWVARAVLPWSAASVARIWGRTLMRTGSEAAALAALAAAEAATLAREARRSGPAGRYGVLPLDVDRARGLADDGGALVPAARPRAKREAGANPALPPQL